VVILIVLDGGARLAVAISRETTAFNGMTVRRRAWSRSGRDEKPCRFPSRRFGSGVVSADASAVLTRGLGRSSPAGNEMSGRIGDGGDPWVRTRHEARTNKSFNYL